jgi:antitoxin ParD1/3/4
MNVSLTPELEDFIEQEVQTGMYQSASEVIRAGLRLLKEEKVPRPRFMVSSAEELEEKLLLGIRQLDRGEGIPGSAAAKELRDRAQARRKRNG